MQNIIDRCFTIAQEQGTGIAISQLRRSLSYQNHFGFDSFSACIQSNQQVE